MTKQFNDIMQKFYDDPTLGIKNEDMTTAGVAGAGDDSSTVVVKKKKKNMYDGRRKEAKNFLKRMETLKASRESKLKKQVKEQIEDFNREYLLEGNFDVLKNIVKNKQHNKIKLKDGTLKVDLFTASAIIQIHDKVNTANKKKIVDMIDNGGKAQFMKLVGLAMK